MHVSDVTNEILNNPRFEGAIESITWLTDWTDVGFGMAITVVAFLIILVAMFKNVLAAAYCAYPKFWNHVNEAHEKKKDTNALAQVGDMLGNMRGGNIGAVNGATVGEIVLGVIPDIKRMTDFEGDTIGAKQYFMKAIPQMLVCVCLGAFIYNGSYRDVAGRVVDFGTEMLNRTLLEFDPIAMFDDFTGTAGRPVFSTDGALKADEQYANKIAQAYYTAIIGAYDDITTAEQKRSLANWSEARAFEIVDGIKGRFSQVFEGDSSKFTIAVAMTWSGEVLDSSRIDNSIGEVTKDPLTFQYAAQTAVDGAVNGVSDLSKPQYSYLIVRCTMVKQNEASASSGASDCVLYLPVTGSITVQVGANSGSKTYFPATPSSGKLVSTSGRDGDSSRVVIEAYSVPGTTINAGDTENVRWSFVTTDGAGHTYTHTITKVVFVESSESARLETSDTRWPELRCTSDNGCLVPQGAQPAGDGSEPGDG